MGYHFVRLENHTHAHTYIHTHARTHIHHTPVLRNKTNRTTWPVNRSINTYMEKKFHKSDALILSSFLLHLLNMTTRLYKKTSVLPIVVHVHYYFLIISNIKYQHISLNFIYFTTITKRVIQLILIMLVGTDVCVRMVFGWEETGVPGGNAPVWLGDHMTI